MVHHYFLKYLGKEAKIIHWPVILHAILIEGGFFSKGGGETWADVKCEGKESSVSDKLIILLSDRCAVNHCVTEGLRETMNPLMVELHCNVHPLQSLASNARATLKERGVKGKVYGKDCAVANLIQTKIQTGVRRSSSLQSFL